MPQAHQGDIFEHALTHDHDLVVVFGHVGCNQLFPHWRRFARHVPGWEWMQDPFSDLSDRPYLFSIGRWMVFVPDEENSGMDDAALQALFAELGRFAREHGLRKVLTNGIADTDHGRYTLENRRSDDTRARLLWNLACAWECEQDAQLTLISLNDVFVRNLPRLRAG